MLDQTQKNFVFRKFAVLVGVKPLEKLPQLLEVRARHQLRQNVLVNRLLENVVLLEAVNIGDHCIIKLYVSVGLLACVLEPRAVS